MAEIAMSETERQRPLARISQSLCFYNNCAVKLDALDESKCMYRALSTFLSSSYSELKEKTDDKDSQNDTEAGKVNTIETIQRQLRPSTRIQRSANGQKRKCSEATTRSGKQSSENLYLNEKIRRNLKTSDLLRNISYCSSDPMNSERLKRRRSRSVLKRRSLNSKFSRPSAEEYRRKLRSSNSVDGNCENMKKPFSSSRLRNNGSSEVDAGQAYASDLDVICEFQCRPIFVILEKLSKHKINELIGVQNFRTKPVESVTSIEYVDAGNTKDIGKNDEALGVSTHKLCDNFIGSSCLHNENATELSAEVHSKQLGCSKSSVESDQRVNIHNVSSSSSESSTDGLFLENSEFCRSAKLTDSENVLHAVDRVYATKLSNKTIICHQPQEMPSTNRDVDAASVGSSLPDGTLPVSTFGSNKVCTQVANSVVTDDATKASLADDIDSSKDIYNGGDFQFGDSEICHSSSESTIDLSDEWTSLAREVTGSLDISAPQTSQPSSHGNASELPGNARSFSAVSANLDIPDCGINENMGSQSIVQNSSREQRKTLATAKRKNKTNKSNSKRVSGRKRHQLDRYMVNSDADCRNNCSVNSCDVNQNQPNIFGDSDCYSDCSIDGSNERRGSSDISRSSSVDCCDSRSCSSDKKRSITDKISSSNGGNGLCASQNLSHIDGKCSDSLNCLSGTAKEKTVDSRSYEFDAASGKTNETDQSCSIKNCSKSSSNKIFEAAVKNDAQLDAPCTLQNVVDDEYDCSDPYVPNFMIHSYRTRCRYDLTNEWKQVANLEEWWLNDGVNFESNLEDAHGEVEDDELGDKKEKLLERGSFEWCALLADQSEWPEIDLCSQDRAVSDPSDVDKCQANRLTETTDTFGNELKRSSPSICHLSEEQQARLLEVSENNLLCTDRIGKSFTSSLRTVENKRNEEITNVVENNSADSRNEFVCEARNKLSPLISETSIEENLSNKNNNFCVKKDEVDMIVLSSQRKCLGSTVTSNVISDSGFVPQAYKTHASNTSLGFGDSEKPRLNMPYFVSCTSQSWLPSPKLQSDFSVPSAISSSSVAPFESHSSTYSVESLLRVPLVKNRVESPATPRCSSTSCGNDSLLYARSSVSSLSRSSDKSTEASKTHFSNCAMLNPTSFGTPGSSAFSTVFFDSVDCNKSPSQSTICNQNPHNSSLCNPRYLSSHGNDSTVPTGSNNCPSSTELDVYDVPSLSVASPNISLFGQISSSDLQFGKHSVPSCFDSRKSFDNMTYISSRGQKSCFPTNYPVSSSEAISNAMINTTLDISPNLPLSDGGAALVEKNRGLSDKLNVEISRSNIKVKYQAKVSSTSASADGNSEIITSSSSGFESSGMINSSWSVLSDGIGTDVEIRKRQAQTKIDSRTSKSDVNDNKVSKILASERKSVPSQSYSDTAFDATVRYQNTSAGCIDSEYLDPVLPNEENSAPYNDCNSDMCSWLAASMGLYTCNCGAAFSDSWSCQQHQFKCSVMLRP